MSEPVDLNELRLEASYAENALLDAYRLTREALDDASRRTLAIQGAMNRGNYVEAAGLVAALGLRLDDVLLAALALVTPEGNTDD